MELQKNLQKLVDRRKLEIFNSRVDVPAPSIPETSRENNVEALSDLESANPNIAIATANLTETPK